MVASTKRYYWLKLKDDFFRSKAMKKLRRIAGGDTYTIIYLKMMLNSITNGGILYYDGVEDDFCNELALDLDEDVENVKMTVAFLTAQGLLEQKKADEFFLPEASDSIGSETTAAARMRKSRETRKESIECNNVTPMLQDVLNGYTEIEKEKDIELDTERKQPDKPAESSSQKSKRFVKPTLEEIKAYCQSRQNGVDAERFYDYYESNGWRVGKSPMRDWKAAVRTWERNERNYGGVRDGTSTITVSNPNWETEF